MESLAAQWTAKIKRTMSVDVSRFTKAGMPAEQIVERLFDIPEVAQAFHLRANQRQPLSRNPSTPDETREIANALDRVAAWLDDGFHERTVEELRSIACDLDPDCEPARSPWPMRL